MRMPRGEDERVFVNRYGQPLGAAGVRYRRDQYVNAAAKSLPALVKKRITPHIFRHTVGVALVSAGGGHLRSSARRRDRTSRLDGDATLIS